MNSTLLNRHPELKDFFTELKYEIQQAQRPAAEIILCDEDVMKMLKISKRTLQYMKSDRVIPFELLRSRSYYRLSDILDVLRKNRVESISNKTRL